MTFGNLMLARYASNTVYAIPGSAITIMNYEDVIHDPYNLVTIGAAWKFTADHDGYYFCKASLLWANITWAAGKATQIFLYKNNAQVTSLDYFLTVTLAGARYIHSHGCDVVWLDKGDFVDFRLWQTNLGAVNTYNNHVYNNCSIYRI